GGLPHPEESLTRERGVLDVLGLFQQRAPRIAVRAAALDRLDLPFLHAHADRWEGPAEVVRRPAHDAGRALALRERRRRMAHEVIPARHRSELRAHAVVVLGPHVPRHVGPLAIAEMHATAGAILPDRAPGDLVDARVQ